MLLAAATFLIFFQAFMIAPLLPTLAEIFFADPPPWDGGTCLSHSLVPESETVPVDGSACLIRSAKLASLSLQATRFGSGRSE